VIELQQEGSSKNSDLLKKSISSKNISKKNMGSGNIKKKIFQAKHKEENTSECHN
jgi:hypothetical protein